VKALAENFYGIREVRLIEAAGLDVDGADAESILRDAEEKYNL
jgi:FMN-dependent NADH-azoreductase